jgi:HlyD family secretion protein
VPRVRLGQRAKITSRALDRPLTGKVVEIGRMIFKNDVLNVDPAAKTDARVVEVRIALDDGAAVAGLTNLTVDVVISPDSDVSAVESSGSIR